GDGSRLDNVNADSLDGFHAGAFQSAINASGGRGEYVKGISPNGDVWFENFANIDVDNFSVTTLYGIGLWDGDSSLGMQGGEITLDATSSGGPPHDFEISPDGTVSMGHSLYVSSNGAFGGNMQVNGNMLISSGLTAYGVCSLGDLYAHDIVSQNNLTAQGCVIGGCASFTGDVTARGYNTSSDRAAKENFLPITSRDILEKVVGLPISRWNFKADATTQHIGPMAQDFYAAFNVGTDEKHIAIVDEGGVALAAIQGLHEIVREKDADIAALKQRLTDLEKAVSELAKQKGNTP
ncbi:MAG TPA: tail fiber domain-containing protein, partial [Verrucomicrobiae bacterium]